MSPRIKEDTQNSTVGKMDPKERVHRSAAEQEQLRIDRCLKRSESPRGRGGFYFNSEDPGASCGQKSLFQRTV
jgi:hypothetical protein